MVWKGHRVGELGLGGGGWMRDESRIYWGSSLRLRSSGQL